jgi:hypothetical protein
MALLRTGFDSALFAHREDGDKKKRQALKKSCFSAVRKALVTKYAAIPLYPTQNSITTALGFKHSLYSKKFSSAP